MEKEILSPIPLLDQDKTLSEGGWARKMMWKYSRKEAFSPSLREEDLYVIIDHDKKIAFAIGIMQGKLKARRFIAFVDLEKSMYSTVSSSKIGKKEGGRLSESPENDDEISYFDTEMTLAAVKRGNKRQLLFTAPHLSLPSEEVGIKAHIELHRTAEEMLSRATSAPEDWKKWSLQAIDTPLKAEGILFIDHKPVTLSDNARGWYVFNRTKWQKEGQCFYSSINGNYNNEPWSIIILGRQNFLESFLSWNGTIQKIGTTTFKRNSDRLWMAESEDGRIKIEFHAEADMSANGSQIMFGTASGILVKANDELVTIEDGIGWAAIREG